MVKGDTMRIISEYIKYLNNYHGYLTKQQYKTLKEKLKQGDILAVRKGLVTILKRQSINVSLGKW